MSAEITPQWNQCLAIIRDNIDEQAYDKWFEPIKPLKYVDNTLTIEVPSPFFPELLEQNFAKLIRYTLNKVYGESTKLMYRWTKRTRKAVIQMFPAQTGLMTPRLQQAHLQATSTSATVFPHLLRGTATSCLVQQA